MTVGADGFSQFVRRLKRNGYLNSEEIGNGRQRHTVHRATGQGWLAIEHAEESSKGCSRFSAQPVLTRPLSVDKIDRHTEHWHVAMKYKLTWGLRQAAIPICLGFSLPALAQDCRITGRVLDDSRTAVATAVVTATQMDSGSTRQVLSNPQGYFQLAQLPPGNYRIEAVKPGFAPLSRTGVDLGAGMTTTLDLQMKEAEVSETVTLEARKTSAESLLVYICGLSRGSGCEMLEPALSAATLSPATADPPVLP
jgi:hypothetical protein